MSKTGEAFLIEIEILLLFRCRKEIHSVLGKARVTSADMHSLPFVQVSQRDVEIIGPWFAGDDRGGAAVGVCRSCFSSTPHDGADQGWPVRLP